MNDLFLEFSTADFQFIKARKTRKIQDAKSIFCDMTGRDYHWDFKDDFFYRKDADTRIRRSGKHIETIGGLKAWIIPYKENNRTKAYYVVAMQVSKQWLDNEDNNSYTWWKGERSWCGIKNWPEFSLQDTIDSLDKEATYKKLKTIVAEKSEDITVKKSFKI